MQHLDTERIAAFDHDAPTAGELAHLAACKVCRAERTALAELSQMAMHAADIPMSSTEPRLTSWESLSTKLRAEGLITTAPSTVRDNNADNNEALPFKVHAASTSTSWLSRGTARTRPEWLRFAAAALLFVAGGAVLDRASIGSLFGSQNSGSTQAETFPGVGLGSTGFSSLSEANRALTRSQAETQRASLWIAANDTSTNTPDMVRRRLAALDQMLSASRAGLADSPQDPVLKSYYSAAYAAREVTLQQLGGALAVGRSLERY